MLRSWAHQIHAWWQRRGAHATGRRIRARRRLPAPGRAALVSQLEILEARQLLTSVVAVHVHDNSIRLVEQGGGSTSTQFAFSVSYTSSEVDLSSSNGTMFEVNGQTEASDTINITGPASLTVLLNRHSNDVSISGDGTDNLSALNFRLGVGNQDNTLTLNSVIADSITIHGQRPNDAVQLNQTTVNGNLFTAINRAAGDTLDLESTTVNGNVTNRAGQLTMNQSTVTGTLKNFELRKDSTLTSTDSTYTGAASIWMGPSGVVNFDSSDSGANQFNGAVSIIGGPFHPTTVNEEQGAVNFIVTPTFKHANVNNTTGSTLGTPTVNSQTITTNTAPVITGTYDAVNTVTFTVAFQGTTYTLGTSSQLTSPSSGQWSLNVNGATLTSAVTTVTATSTDSSGNQKTGTGTITDGQGIINEYLKANNLTATTTADGLNYVIQTEGTGAVPTAGETVSVNYSGFLMNTNGTQGTEFDSNTNSQFGHVMPFTFTLGAGQVIAGWDEAFALLPVGTVATLLIPPSLGYGASGQGSTIPPNSILIFDVTVLSAS